MKKMNKLVALLLAAVMVLGLMPTVAPHAHAHAHTHGIEEYPALSADTPAEATFTEAGQVAYFTFTPEVTDRYYFYSNAQADTKGYIYDAEMNQINYNDDSNYGYALGIYSPNFCMEQVMEAGTTYILAAQPYQNTWTGTFTVEVMTGHSYTSEVTKEATCDEDGVLTYTCSYCGDTYDEVIPAAHSYDEETGNCIHCGEAYLVTGTCGEALTWSLDWFGKLTISGTGDMYHYSHSWDAPYYAPWYDYVNDIKELVVEEGVTSIGNYAFKDCQYATAVTLPETLTALGTHSFDACYGITEIALPDAITVIPDSCFYYCGTLSKVEWPASLTEVQASAFYSCDLPDVVVPEGVTTIGQYAFGGNSKLSKLTLPTTLTTVDNYGFASMYDVKDFVFTGDAPSFGGANVFNWITANAWYPLGNETWTEEVCQNYGGTITWKGLCTGSHTWGEAVTIPATCTDGSYMTMSCTVCGYTEISPENDDALGHDFQYEHYEGTCGEYSYDIVSCSRCDYYTTDNWVWKDHTWETSHVDATCEVGGYDLSICTICGTRSESNYTAPLGHDVAEWSEPTEATCTEPSVKTGTCARCEQTVSEKLADALGHEWDTENGVANGDGSVTYSCIRCGETYRTEGSILYNGDNTFTVAASTGRTTKTYTAEQSGTLTITLNQMVYHNQTAWENGWSDQYWQSLGMQWVFSEGFFNVYINDQNTGYTVVNEGELVLNAVEVNAGDVVTVEVNHTESSYYYSNDVQFNMNLALESSEPEVPSLVLGDNSLELENTAVFTGSWTAETDGNLTVQMTKLEYDFYGWWAEEPVDAHLSEGDIVFLVNGSAVNSASGSTTLAVKAGDVVTAEISNFTGFKIRVNVNLSLSEPEPETVALVLGDNTLNMSASTEGDGELGEWTAEANGTLSISVSSVAYFDDYWNEWISDMPVDRAFKYGWFVLYVNGEAVDGSSSDVEVQAGDVVTVKVGNFYGYESKATVNLTFTEPHQHQYEAVVTEPTCTEGGYTTYTCACGDSYVGDYTDKLGHDYQVHEIVPPTCSKSGYTVYKCTRCEDTYKDDPVEPEHKFDEGTVVEPTCTEMGCTVYTCLVCGFEYEQEGTYTPALGHDYVNGDCTRCDSVLTSDFVDVPAGVFYFDPVEWAVDNGITNGTDAIHFDPDGECMRAVVVTFLWRAAGEPAPTNTVNPFVDVYESDFYYNAVLWAVEKGITNGMDATHFEPYTKCNRAQVVTFLYRAMGRPDYSATASIFSDVTDPTAFYYDAALWAAENNISNGMGDGSFGVDAICNRAQVVTFLYRTYKN